MLHIGGFFFANLIVLLVACFIANNFDIVSMWKESSEGDRMVYLLCVSTITLFFSFMKELT